MSAFDTKESGVRVYSDNLLRVCCDVVHYLHWEKLKGFHYKSGFVNKKGSVCYPWSFLAHVGHVAPWHWKDSQRICRLKFDRFQLKVPDELATCRIKRVCNRMASLWKMAWQGLLGQDGRADQIIRNEYQSQRRRRSFYVLIQPTPKGSLTCRSHPLDKIEWGD